MDSEKITTIVVGSMVLLSLISLAVFCPLCRRNKNTQFDVDLAPVRHDKLNSDDSKRIYFDS